MYKDMDEDEYLLLLRDRVLDMQAALGVSGERSTEAIPLDILMMLERIGYNVMRSNTKVGSVTLKEVTISVVTLGEFIKEFHRMIRWNEEFFMSRGMPLERYKPDDWFTNELVMEIDPRRLEGGVDGYESVPIVTINIAGNNHIGIMLSVVDDMLCVSAIDIMSMVYHGKTRSDFPAFQVEFEFVVGDTIHPIVSFSFPPNDNCEDVTKVFRERMANVVQGEPMIPVSVEPK